MWFTDDTPILAKVDVEIGQISDMLADAPTGWSWENKKLNNANSTSSTVCIVRRDSCGNFGTIPCTQVVGSYEKESHTWQPLQLEHHLPAASKVVYANSSILCDRTVSTAQQLVHFDVTG